MGKLRIFVQRTYPATAENRFDTSTVFWMLYKLCAILHNFRNFLQAHSLVVDEKSCSKSLVCIVVIEKMEIIYLLAKNFNERN